MKKVSTIKIILTFISSAILQIPVYAADTNTTQSFRVVDVDRTPNERIIAFEEGLDTGEDIRVEKVIDDTEALGAMVSIDWKTLTQGTSNWYNLDLGGGKFDISSEYLLEKFGVNSLVYDPYHRLLEHNKSVLARKYHSVTSNSVLNVIEQESCRRIHIEQAFASLRPGGVVFFKVWRGNNSNVPQKSKSSYQANKSALYFLEEVRKIFPNATVLKDNLGNTIFAHKPAQKKSVEKYDEKQES